MDTALWEHRWECPYFMSLVVCACMCACLCVHVHEIETEAWGEEERGGGESQRLGLCIYVSPSMGFSIFPLFSSLPLSFLIFPLTTSITLKMNITWHGGTHFYDLLYSLTRTFCSLLKEDNTTDTKSPQCFPESSGLGWMKAPLPSTFCLLAAAFPKEVQLWQPLKQWKCVYIPDKSPQGLMKMF